MKLRLNIFLLILMTSCISVSSSINDEEDKEDALGITSLYFDHIKKQEFDSVHTFFGETFSMSFNKRKLSLSEFFRESNKKLGDLQKTELDYCVTQRVSGTKNYTKYDLVFNNTYQKYTAEETFGLIKNKDSIIKINYYAIKSEGFNK